MPVGVLKTRVPADFWEGDLAVEERDIAKVTDAQLRFVKVMFAEAKELSRVQMAMFMQFIVRFGRSRNFFVLHYLKRKGDGGEESETESEDTDNGGPGGSSSEDEQEEKSEEECGYRSDELRESLGTQIPSSGSAANL